MRSVKKQKIACKYRQEWSRYRMKSSKKGVSYAFCTVCSVDISIAGGGQHEIERHMKTTKHLTMLNQLNTQPTLSSFVTDSRSIEEQAVAAEVYFAKFVAEHNIPFLVADHFSRLTKVMFPDSKIAEAYSCARTKTTAIITHALAPAMREVVDNECSSTPFTILCDGGNDRMDRKYFAILVRYWDDVVDQAVTRFLGMPTCNIATAEKLFEALDTTMENRGLPWNNVVGFASDSASVMVGVHNSVLSRVRSKQPRVFSLGCLCHLANLCATSALKTLPVSVDNLLIDVFYHFKYSAKRWEEFCDIQAEFEDIKPLRVLKHSTTRWLSLLRCLRRLLGQWPALHSYFDRRAEEQNDDRVQRVASHLSSLQTKLICRFVLYALQALNKFTTIFQTHASRIGTMQDDMLSLLRGYLANFIKPEVIVAADDITALDYKDKENQLPNESLAVGTETLLFLSEMEDDIEGTTIERKFFDSVRLFYETTVTKMLAKFPHKDKTISDLSFLNPRNRVKTSSASIARLARRFLTEDPDEIDGIVAEFLSFQVAPDHQLPSFDHTADVAIDHFWSQMARQKAIGDLSSLAYPTLSELAKTLLVLPHSNVDPERLFSMVGKIETQSRSQLSSSTTCDLLTVKMNHDSHCFASKDLVIDDLLKAAKSATRRSLQELACKNN